MAGCLGGCAGADDDSFVASPDNGMGAACDAILRHNEESCRTTDWHCSSFDGQCYKDVTYHEELDIGLHYSDCFEPTDEHGNSLNTVQYLPGFTAALKYCFEQPQISCDRGAEAYCYAYAILSAQGREEKEGVSIEVQAFDNGTARQCSSMLEQCGTRSEYPYTAEMGLYAPNLCGRVTALAPASREAFDQCYELGCAGFEDCARDVLQLGPAD